MKTFSTAYRGKRVLVSGLTGFKGQWLGRWLSRLGAEVAGFGLPPTADPAGGRPDVSAEFDCRLLDVRDADAVRRLVAETRPEVIFHLAAQPLVRLSYEEPAETFATNVMGTVHVLDAARRAGGVRAVVNVTSDKCYENREWHWAYREDEPMGGHDPYSASKGCSELVTAAYRRSFATGPDAPAIASGRAGNVIGGGDWSANRIVPDIVRAVLAGEPVVLRRPESVRPWQHVLEVTCGYLRLGAALLDDGRRYATGWNFGPDEADAVPVRTLARGMTAAWGRGEIVEEPHPTGPHEAKYLKLDSSKARAELDWAPLLSVAERIEWTIDWYARWSRDPSAYWALIDEQVAAYEARWEGWCSRDRFSFQAPPAAAARPSRAA